MVDWYFLCILLSLLIKKFQKIKQTTHFDLREIIFPKNQQKTGIIYWASVANCPIWKINLVHFKEKQQSFWHHH